MRSWQKAGQNRKKKAFSHLQRRDKAELEKATVSVIPTLEAQEHALTLAVEAKDAALLR